MFTKLNRTKQCTKCPWRKDVDPFSIPNGYCVKKHQNLQQTIAPEINTSSVEANLESISALLSQPLTVFVCHESGGDNDPCIGWLNHQLGRGNNISLRIAMMRCENIQDIQTVGDQHQTFEETLPEINTENHE